MKIIIIGATHGHERIGARVIEALQKISIPNDSVECIIGNPRAYEHNVPFVESDLNRVFPGDAHGTYEERRAHELSEKIRTADIVIDIHSTNTTDLSENSMLIVTKYDDATRDILDFIAPPKVLVMNYKNTNALISQAKIGIAFEYGRDTSDAVLQATLFDIVRVLIRCGIISENPFMNPRPSTATEVYEIYDAFSKDPNVKYILNSHLKNFELCQRGFEIATDQNGEVIQAPEDFYPILFGENRYTHIFGFRARKCD